MTEEQRRILQRMAQDGQEAGLMDVHYDDFNPGEGWRSISDEPDLGVPHLHEHVANGIDRFWVREHPVPPLPTEPLRRIAALIAPRVSTRFAEGDVLADDIEQVLRDAGVPLRDGEHGPEPVPPLPTEPWTVIRVRWDAQGNNTHPVFLFVDGLWRNKHGDVLDIDDVTGFEVLAVPVSGEGRDWIGVTRGA